MRHSVTAMRLCNGHTQTYVAYTRFAREGVTPFCLRRVKVSQDVADFEEG